MLIGALGNCALVSLNDLSENAINHLLDPDMPVLLFTDSPNADITRFILDSDFPVIIPPIDFPTACHEFMQAHDCSLMDSVRSVAFSRLGLWEVSRSGRAKQLNGTEDLQNWRQDIQRRLGIGFNDGSDETPPAPLGLTRGIPALGVDPIADAAIAQLAEFYGQADASDACKLSMPICLMNEGVAPFGPSTGQIDLEGPARCLTFGPFLFLPAGDWQATVEFAAYDCATHNSFKFDVIADGYVKTKGEFDITQDGKFSFQNAFSVNDPWSPVEFRTFLDKGSIAGQFTLGSVTATRRSDCSALLHDEPVTSAGQAIDRQL